MHAQPPPPPIQRYERAALHAARSYWRDPAPCGGNVRVVEGSSGYFQEGKEVAAWVTFQTPAGEGVYEARPYTDCVIHVTPPWMNVPQVRANFETYCQLMTHEVGHLEGHSDEHARPGTVEYQDPTTAPETKPCEREEVWLWLRGELL